MTALVSRPREIFTWGTPVPPTWMRQPRLPSFPYIVAMHWDDTHRDRLRPVQAPAMYWEESAIPYMPSARSIAKHLKEPN